MATQMWASFDEDKANKLIQRKALWAAGWGVWDPTPGGADVPAMVVLWTSMLFDLAKIYRVEFDQKAFKIMAKQALQAAGLMFIGLKTFAGIMKYTGFLTWAGMAINGSMNYAFTYAIGKLYQQAFREGWEPTEADIKEALENARKNKRKDQ